MKKNNLKIIALIIVVVILIVSMIMIITKNSNNKKEEQKPTVEEKEVKKQFKLSFEKKKCNSKNKIIYEYPDGKKIKSKCGEVYYTDDDYDKITLEEALNKKLIVIEDISSNMELVWGAFDGGSSLFANSSDNLLISDSKFNLEVCKNISGTKDIFFLSSKDETNYCK